MTAAFHFQRRLFFLNEQLILMSVKCHKIVKKAHNSFKVASLKGARFVQVKTLNFPLFREGANPDAREALTSKFLRVCLITT